MGINLASQVLIARQLTKVEFGGFATALAVAGLAQVIITLGLHRGATPFIARFEQDRNYPRLTGTILLYIGVVVGMGTAVVVLFGLGEGWLVASGSLDATSTALLLILVLLAPVDALDDMLIGLFAIFGSPRSIFVRRYLLGPLIRLGLAAILVFADGNARQLAIGYLLGGVFAVVLYGVLFIKLLRDRGLLAPIRAHRPEIPVREVLGFSIPLLSTDAIWLLLNTFPLIVLTAASGLQEVAEFQVIRPTAALNLLVSGSFYVLYLPIASRVAARADAAEARELYWRATIWVAVMTFPIFAGTFALGQGLAGWLFGEQYASSGVVLSILSIGYFVHAALGFNSVTLGAHGHPRTVLLVNMVAAASSILIVVALIPPFGAIGAAAAATVTLLIQNGLLQYAMQRRVGIPMLEREALGVYTVIATAIGFLIVAELILGFGWWSVVLTGLAALAVLYRCRASLQIDTLFPEVHPLAVRVMARLGPRARGVVTRLDMLWTAGPLETWRSTRTARAWATLASGPDGELHARIWTQAAASAGAEARPTGPGTIELRAGDRRVLVGEHIRNVGDATDVSVLDRPSLNRLLHEAGSAVPGQLAFRFDKFDAAAAFLRDSDGPCVIKAAVGATGSDVITHVRTRSDLVRAIIRAGRHASDLVIERQVAGREYRLLLLDGELLDAIERLPSFVVGDGHSSVGTLIDVENRHRIHATDTERRSLLDVDLDCVLTLRSAGVDLGSVPAAGDTIAVKSAAAQDASADSHSVAAEIGPALIGEALRAAAIAGNRVAVVDVVTTDPTTTLAAAGGVIVDVRADPDLHVRSVVRRPDDASRVAAVVARTLLERA